MEKKYIIKLEENEIAYKTVNSNGRPMIGLLHPSPYTEPDLEQVRKGAYEKGWKEAEDHYEKGYNDGYDTGLSHAWEAARNVVALSTVDRRKVFGSEYMYSILEKHTAAEAIEKIRQYEGSKEKHTWIYSEVNEPSVDTTLICSKCGYAIKIKPHETPELNFCPKCGDCKKPKE